MHGEFRFYAEKTSGHRHARLAGTVLIVNPNVKNGVCRLAWGVPTGQRKALPVETWASPSHLAKRCIEVSEKEARQLHPEIFEARAKYLRSPEYRIGHWFEAMKSPLANDSQVRGTSGDLFRQIYGD